MLLTASAGAQDAHQQGLDGKFRGGYVCEKLPTTRGILRVPIDLAIHDGSVQFARPLFNLDGTVVVGSELGNGTIDAGGMLHLTSDWSYLGNSAQGEYSGRLTPSGGTLTGTQTWRTPDGGAPLRRSCTVALVPAPKIAAQE